MPDLNSSIHLDMLDVGKQHRKLGMRAKRALAVFKQAASILVGLEPIYKTYGLEWGDPDQFGPLSYVKDHYLLPYVKPESTIVEIGPGGGRWTRYMESAKQIYAVDYHRELLVELEGNMRGHNIKYIKNDGDNFPGIAEKSIDFVFSFGTFVHLELDIIERYLKNIRSLLHEGSCAVIHYSDKTKPIGKKNDGFSDNNPEKMRKMVSEQGYEILEEDLYSICHSSIIRFGLPRA